MRLRSFMSASNVHLSLKYSFWLTQQQQLQQKPTSIISQQMLCHLFGFQGWFYFFYFPSVRFLVCLVLTNAFRLKISSTLIFEWNQMILIGHKINVFACWLKLKQETTMCHHKVESDNHLMFLLFSILFDVFWLIIYYLFYSFNFSKILFFLFTQFSIFFTTIAQQWLHLGLLKFYLKKWARLDRSCISSDYFCYFLRCLCSSFVRIWIIANIWENVHSKYQLINIWMKHWKWQIKRKIAFKLNILIWLWCFWC